MIKIAHMGEGEKMFKNQRHGEILDILKEQGFAGVKELSDRLYASQPTVRRDLDILEKQGYVRRSHGGAVLADGRVNTPIPFRRGRRTKEKVSICRLAATLIEEGDLVFTDASTTAFYISEFIKETDHVTVLTNGLSICAALSERNITVFSTGGRLLKESEAFAGRHAEAALEMFNADVMFFSTSAFDGCGMISDFSEEEVALRRVMRARSARAVFLCDSEKFGKTSAFVAFSLDEVDNIVTDNPLEREIAEKYGFAVIDEQDGCLLYGKAEKMES